MSVVSSPLWVTYSAFLLKVAARSKTWASARPHYRAPILSSVLSAVDLLRQIPTGMLTDELFERYSTLYRHTHYRRDARNEVKPLNADLWAGAPVDFLFELLEKLSAFFCEAKNLVCAPVNDFVYSGPGQGKAPKPVPLRIVQRVMPLPQVLALWGVTHGKSTETEKLAFLKAVRLDYPRVPDDVLLRWSEVEQGTTLASKIEDWSEAMFETAKTGHAELLSWNLDGYVPAEYMTAVPLRDIPLDQATWRHRPLLLNGRLLHGIADYRFVRNMPNRLKMAEAHEYLQVTLSKP